MVIGVNGSGKFNLYKVLRLLVELVFGSMINVLVKEGGLDFVFWVGLESILWDMKVGRVVV